MGGLARAGANHRKRRQPTQEPKKAFREKLHENRTHQTHLPTAGHLQPTSGGPTFARNMSALDSFIDGSELSAAEAKREFFLTPADLKALPSRPLGAWGCGNTRLYNTDVLVAAAVAKYGADGLRKKKLAREVREDKKRKRVEVAADAEESLREGALAPAPGAAVADAAAVRGLVAEARRALKASCTWDYLRSKSAPHGASTSVG